MNLLVFTRYPRIGASSRLRFFQFLPALEASGINVHFSPLFSEAFLRRRYTGRTPQVFDLLRAYTQRLAVLTTVAEYDAIWLQYELFPWMPATVERILTTARVPVIVDYDDAIFHQYDLHENPFVRRVLGKKIDVIMRGASVVVAGSRYLGDHARAAGARRVEYIPTVVDSGRYGQRTHSDASLFRIGWIGSPSTAAYLPGIADALRQAAQGGRILFEVIGSGPLSLPGVPLELRSWSENTEVSDISKFDVGLMPIPDTPWGRGKCGYKLIQYMACGVPVIASPVGINVEIVSHGVNGFLARTTNDWVTALELLRKDVKLRAQMGQAGRDRVIERYSIRAVAPQLVELIKSMKPGGVPSGASGGLS